MEDAVPDLGPGHPIGCCPQGGEDRVYVPIAHGCAKQVGSGSITVPPERQRGVDVDVDILDLGTQIQ